MLIIVSDFSLIRTMQGILAFRNSLAAKITQAVSITSDRSEENEKETNIP